MIKRIDLYICQNILTSTALVTAVISVLAVLVRFIREIKRVGDHGYGWSEAILYVVLKIPSDLHTILPLLVLIGSLMAVGGMAANRELIVLRSAGMSMLRMALSVGYAGIILALISIAIIEYLGPVGENVADNLRHSARHETTAKVIRNTTWLQQNQRIVRIGRIQQNGQMNDITIYELGQDRRVDKAIYAQKAKQHKHSIVLDHPKISTIGLDQVHVTHPKELKVPVELKSNILELAAIKPDKQSSWMLWHYIDYLKHNKIEASEYQLSMWQNFVAPLTIILLTLFALPFAFGSLRSTSAGQRLFFGGLIGLSFYLINEIVAPSSMVYGLPPWLAASLPTLLLALGTGAWLKKMN